MAPKVYTVVVAGTGKRGKHHIAAFQRNPRFQVVGIADPDPGMLAKAAAEFSVGRTSTDPAALARDLHPDVFCFCTPPAVRLALVRSGIAAGARLIAFEKPMAMSMAEALEIRTAVQTAGVKTVVSHQHRYGEHYRKVHEIIRGGALGRIHTIYGHATGWMMHLFTHLLDYMRWFAGEPEAQWVLGQAVGRGKLADNHASPDYITGIIQFRGAIRGWIECGAGAPDVSEVDYWWRKCRIGAQGTEGFAEVLTGGGWRAVTKSAGAISGGGCMNYDLDMPPYIQEMADWLDDDRKVHSCHVESAFKGFEIFMGIIRSAAQGGQVRLPLEAGEPEMDLLKRTLPDRPVLLSGEFNRKEYPTASA